MKKEWTENYFDKLYMKYFLLTQKEEITEQQTTFIKTFLRPGGRVLDTGCGIGRHSISLAKKGFDVVGIDTSDIYLSFAKESSIKEEVRNIEFKKIDMRDMDYKKEFDGVINLWSSFGYYDDETNFEILKNLSEALKRDGILIIDIENRDYLLKNFVYETFKESDGVFILERRNYHPLTSIITTHRFFIGKDLKKEYIRNIRMYSATEMINLYKSAALKEIQVFGNFAGEKFSINSKRIIIIGKKA